MNKEMTKRPNDSTKRSKRLFIKKNVTLNVEVLMEITGMTSSMEVVKNFDLSSDESCWRERYGDCQEI